MSVTSHKMGFYGLRLTNPLGRLRLRAASGERRQGGRCAPRRGPQGVPFAVCPPCKSERQRAGADDVSRIRCDVVTLNCPLHEGTRGIMNKVCFKAPYFAGSCDSPLRVDLQETIGYMKKGAWLVNTARGALCDENAVAEAINSGYLSG